MASSILFRRASVLGGAFRGRTAMPFVANLPTPLPASSFSSRTFARTQSFIDISQKDAAGRKTAEDAVNNILYNAPTVTGQAEKHTLSVLVDNEAGVLSKVSGLLSARGFNINSLSVSATDVRDLSRMTIVLQGAGNQVEQAKRQLEDLVDVWAVLDFRGASVLERELCVIKVNCVPPEPEDQLLTDDVDQTGSYEGLMSQHFHRQAIGEITKMFDAQVVDIGSDHMMIQMVSWPSRVGAFIKMLQPFGIIEAARSGVIAMSRSPVGGAYEDLENAEELRTKVDLADLPPS